MFTLIMITNDVCACLVLNWLMLVSLFTYRLHCICQHTFFVLLFSLNEMNSLISE